MNNDPDWADVLTDDLFRKAKWDTHARQTIAATLRRMVKPVSEEYCDPSKLDDLLKGITDGRS